MLNIIKLFELNIQRMYTIIMFGFAGVILWIGHLNYQLTYYVLVAICLLPIAYLIRKLDTMPLIFAFLMIADRFSPSLVFFVCAILGALCNYFTIFEGNDLINLLIFRFLTGFFLAGIYPVGMKIASDYYQKGLGKSLGYLVGALVIGTAFPHLLKGIQNFQNIEGSSSVFSWRLVIQATSLIAVLGGVLMFVFVPNRSVKSAQKIKFTAFFQVFKSANFRFRFKS